MCSFHREPSGASSGPGAADKEGEKIWSLTLRGLRLAGRDGRINHYEALRQSPDARDEGPHEVCCGPTGRPPRGLCDGLIVTAVQHGQQ